MATNEALGLMAHETPEQWARVRAAFEELHALGDDARVAWLAELRAADPSLSAAVEDLLVADDAADDGFLDPPITAAVGASESDLAGGWSGRRVGSFTLGEVLGAGGMGTVFRARQTNPDREVALKVLRLGLASEASRRRFQYESELLARLRHPSIAQVYEAGFDESDGLSTPWFAMELVEGARPITAFAREHELEWKARVRLLLNVLDAVQHAHQRGVIHRDLKSANLLVDAHGHVKVIDFGVAAVEEREHGVTREGELIGTLATMSPEQLSGQPGDVDARSDVYALGVVLQHVITGEPPYDLRGLSLIEATRVVLEEEPPSVRRSTPALPEELDWIIRRAMEKEPALRYASASEMRADLMRLLDRQPVIAGPPTAAYRLRKFVQRHRFGVSAAALAVLALIFGLGGTIIGWRRALRAEESALIDRQEAMRAEERALLDRKEAINQAELSEEVVQFVLDGLRSPDPSRDGRELTMVDFLEREADSIEARFATRPRVRARLEQVVGRAYFGLGIESIGEEFLQRAIATLREDSGVEPAELRLALSDLAVLCTDQARYTEASELLDEAEALIPVAGREDNLDYWKQRGKRGRLVLRMGDHEQALEMIEDALAKLDGEPEYDQEVGWLESLLGGHAQELGHSDAASEHYSRALGISLKLYGEDHPDVLRMRGNLAVLEHSLGNSERAIELIRAVSASQERLLGPDHLDTVLAKSNLASLLFLLGREDEAAPLWRESLVVLTEEFPPEHPILQTLGVNLGVYDLSLGRFEEADALLLPIYELRVGLYGERDLRTLRVGFELGKIDLQVGDYEDGLDLLDAAFGEDGDLQIADPDLHAIYRCQQIDLWLALEELDEARAHFEVLLAEVERGVFTQTQCPNRPFDEYAEQFGLND